MKASVCAETASAQIFQKFVAPLLCSGNPGGFDRLIVRHVEGASHRKGVQTLPSFSQEGTSLVDLALPERQSVTNPSTTPWIPPH